MNKCYFYTESDPKPKEYLVAGNFNELNKNQLTQVMHVLHSRAKMHTAQIQVLGILLKFEQRPVLFQKLLDKVDGDGLSDLLLLTDFVFKESTLNQSAFPHVKIKRSNKASITLYGPVEDKLLIYMDFLEWIKTEIFYREYIAAFADEKKRVDPLNKLVAVMYRPAGQNPKGDIREPYNDYSLKDRAKQIAKLSINIKYAIFYHFQAQRNLWTKTFKNVYRHADNEESENSTPVSSGELDLYKIMLKMAGGAKDMKQLETTEASIALLELDGKILENKENESHRSN